MVTVRTARTGLSALGVSLRYDRDTEEWRVVRHGDTEENAYYTDDIDDAYLTGISMSNYPR